MNLQTINLIASRSHEQIREIKAKEALLLSDGYLVVPGSPSYDHFKNFKVFSRTDLFDVLNLASRAMEIAIATKDFKHRY